MKCHCNEIEELRVENDLLRAKTQETWDCAASWEARWQEADHKRELAEDKLARVRAYAKEREAYGKRDRTVGSARIASDLLGILNA